MPFVDPGTLYAAFFGKAPVGKWACKRCCDKAEAAVKERAEAYELALAHRTPCEKLYEANAAVFREDVKNGYVVLVPPSAVADDGTMVVDTTTGTSIVAQAQSANSAWQLAPVFFKAREHNKTLTPYW